MSIIVQIFISIKEKKTELVKNVQIYEIAVINYKVVRSYELQYKHTIINYKVSQGDSGGIAIYIKNGINFDIIKDLWIRPSDVDIIGIKN